MSGEPELHEIRAVSGINQCSSFPRGLSPRKRGAGIHFLPDRRGTPAFAGVTTLAIFIPMGGPQARRRPEKHAGPSRAEAGVVPKNEGLALYRAT